MSIMDEEVVVVAAHEDFSDEVLIKHLNARHMPLAGMDSIPEVWREWMEPLTLWREYHNAVHELAVPWGVVNGHTHEESEHG